MNACGQIMHSEWSSRTDSCWQINVI